MPARSMRWCSGCAVSNGSAGPSLRPKSCRAKSCSQRWARVRSRSNAAPRTSGCGGSSEPLHDPRSAACVGAERAMLAALDGSCRTPIAGFAEIDADRLKMEGLLLNEHGSREIRGRFEGGIDDAAVLGAELGKDLRSRAGPD